MYVAAPETWAAVYGAVRPLLVYASLTSWRYCGPVSGSMRLVTCCVPTLVSRLTRLALRWPRRVVTSTTPLAPRAP